MRALNALHYPNQDRQQKLFHHVWTACAGWCVGVALAWGWQHWQEFQTGELQQTQRRLQVVWDTRQQQTKDTTVRQNQGRMLQTQAVYLQQIADHQRAWLGLHERLLLEASSHGLQLARLQVETDKIELHGGLKNLAQMAEVRHSVSAHLPQALAMSRMNAGPVQDWNFVWQAAWPPARPSGLTSPAPPSSLSVAAGLSTSP